MELDFKILSEVVHTPTGMVQPWFDISRCGLHCGAPTDGPMPGHNIAYTGRVTLKLNQGGLRNKIHFDKMFFKQVWKEICKRQSLKVDATGLLFLDYAQGKLKKAVFSPSN